MNGTQSYAVPVNAAGQFDPQGFLGSLLAGAAGGLIGTHIGGSTGQTIRSLAGQIGGGFLPFEAGPTAEAPSDLEMQGFWSVLKKIAQGVGTGLNVGKRAPISVVGTREAVGH